MASEIERIRQTVSLPDLAAGYGVALKQNGTEHEACCPFHREDTASFTIFTGKDHVERFHCFAGETRVITKAGTKAIRDLAGGEHEVLTQGGVWVTAPFRSFGQQPVMQIRLSRNGCHKDIYATDEHRWFVRGRKSAKATWQLRYGDRLSFVVPPIVDAHPSLEGIQHGYVFGDGTRHRKGTRAYIMGENRGWMPAYFPGCKTYTYEDRIIVEGLPAGWKDFPLTDDVDYWAGFLAGFIAADGHVAKDGTISLNQARRDVLERVRDVATSMGIVTFPITEQVRLGITGVISSIFRIHIASSTCPPCLILNPKMRARLDKCSKRFERHRWHVIEVSETDKVEEVFCAEVPDTHSFALEDFILTGNCFGCGAKGDVVDFVQAVKGVDTREAIAILGGREAGPNIAPRSVEVRDVYAGIEALTPVEPIQPRKRVKLYNPKRAGTEREWGSFVPSWVFLYRRLDGSPIGYVLRHELPDGGKETPMVMWARLPDGRECWCRLPFPKPRPLYGLETIGDARQVIVVEGEKVAERLRTISDRVYVAWVGGTQGARHCDWSPLAGRNIVMWPDADPEGRRTSEEIGDILLRFDRTTFRTLDVEVRAS